MTAYGYLRLSLFLLTVAFTALILIPDKRTYRPRPLQLGARIRWTRRKKSGKFETIPAVITKLIGDLVLVEALDDARRIWTTRQQIARRQS
jgi:hypothetical protein